MAGYWKAPRALAGMLVAGELTPNEFALLNLLGESSADRRSGFTTTLGYLAAALAVSDRTIHRALRSLRARGFISYEDHSGAALFTVRTTTALAALVSEPVSEPVSEVASDTTTASDARKPPSVKRKRGVGTSDFSRARAETEIESKKKRDAQTSRAEDLAGLLAPLERADGARLNGIGLDIVRHAYAQDPAAVAKLVRECAVATRVKSRRGLLVRRVQRGDHLGDLMVGLAPVVCPGCGVGGGCHTAECSIGGDAS
jgi:hypothetical protein